MFRKIMAPVDLAHLKGLGRALDVTSDLAARWGAEVTYVGVASSAPSAVAHNPKEFAAKLADFARDQAQLHDIQTTSHAMVAHDPATEVDDALLRAVGETGADLVVMASHVPSIVDYVWPSNGGKIAEHAKCSVMVVRS